jgi:hypothetical protein
MPSPQVQRIIDALKQRQIDRASQPARTLGETRAAFAPAGKTGSQVSRGEPAATVIPERAGRRGQRPPPRPELWPRGVGPP